MKPTKCPHCGATTNPLQLSLYSAGHGYRCSRCEKKSRFDRRALAAFGGIAAMSGAALQGAFHFGGIARIAVVAGGTLVLVAAMWLFLTLRPLDEEKNA